MRPAFDTIPNAGDDDWRILASSDRADSGILEVKVVVGDVETDREHYEGVENNDAKGDLSAGELDGFVSVDMFVLCCSNRYCEESLK